jgi:hypothetical protein
MSEGGNFQPLQVQVSKEDRSYAVSLPCDPDSFTDFIASLLGKPQTIEFYIIDPFEVRREDLVNIHHLIIQRIQAQNRGKMIHFSARVDYDNNSSVTLNTYEAFISYSEVKPLISIGTTLSWTFLIEFSGSRVPEKQEIVIYFNTKPHDRVRLPVPMFEDYAKAAIKAVITHTDRSWGGDIENLLSGQLKTLTHPVGGMKRFVSDRSGWIGFLVGLFVFVCGCIFIWQYTSQFSNGFLKQLNNVVSYGAEQGDSNQHKLDLVLNIIVSGAWFRHAEIVGTILIVLERNPFR